MARTDRGVRRARRHLTANETVLASVIALEDAGRRRQVVVITDQRVLVTGMRGESSLEFPLEGSTCCYQRAGGRLTLRSDGQELVVREVDEVAGRTIVELLAARATRRSAQEAVRFGRVRIDAF
jgi:hypothetical protein